MCSILVLPLTLTTTLEVDDFINQILSLHESLQRTGLVQQLLAGQFWIYSYYSTKIWPIHSLCYGMNV